MPATFSSNHGVVCAALASYRGETNQQLRGEATQAGYVTPRACDFRRGREQRGCRRLRRKRRRPLLRRPSGTPLHDTCRVAKPAAITVTDISSAYKRVSGPMSVVAALALLRRGDAAACKTAALERQNMLDLSAPFHLVLCPVHVRAARRTVPAAGSFSFQVIHKGRLVGTCRRRDCLSDAGSLSPNNCIFTGRFSK